jgi:hypothetical protein
VAKKTCKPDPAATIEALPAGAIFHGSGCYVTDGILIDQPVTIDGGTYEDPVNVAPASGPVRPIIRIRDTTDVTVENVKLIGSNVRGGFHPSLVNQAGLDILSSSDVDVSKVSIRNTFGDGMTLFANFAKDSQPVTDLTVDGMTIENAGREGVTMGYAVDSTLSHVVVDSATQDAWDFESDLTGVGSGDITIDNAVAAKAVRIVEPLQGPVTFNDSHLERHVSVQMVSGQPVTFNGGSVLLTATDQLAPPGGITVNGPANVTFDGVTIGRLTSTRPPSYPAWSVTGGGHLTLIDSPVTPPLGTNDASSTVTIIG